MRNPWLDVCRALAIGLVLIGHARLFVTAAYPALDVLKAGSFFGVELFFVLSGFLIGGILLDAAIAGRSGWLMNFYARRWWRTLPNYYLFVIINVLLVVFAVRPGDLHDVPPYLVFVQSLAWPHPTFFGEAWSLAIEEVFYLAFPIAFVVLSRATAMPLARALLVVAVVVVAASPVARAMLASTTLAWDEQVRKPVVWRLDAIMYGVLLAWGWRHHAALIRHRALQMVALSALAFVVIFVATAMDVELNTSQFAKSLLFSLTSIGCVGLIACGLLWQPPEILAKTTRFLARISYSAYLANIPVALLLLKAWPYTNDGAIAQVARALCFLTVSILAAWAVHLGVERPFLRLREQLSPARTSLQVA